MNRNLVYIILTLVVGILIAIYFYIPFMEKPKTLFTKTKIAIDPTILGSKTDPTLNKDKYKALEPEKALEHYKQWAIYPPFSRPLYKEQLELIEPYSIHLQEVEPIQPQIEGCKKDPEGKCIQENLTVQELKCILKPERSIYIGDIKIKVELYCSEKQQNLEVLQINPQVYTIKIGDKKLNSTASIAFGDDGENGDDKAEDKVYTFLISPTGEDWGQMFLEVDMEVNGKPMNYKASWYYTPHIVAEFQKSAKDSLKDGHLLVSIPITISKEGRYFFEANLQSAGEGKQFIATSTTENDMQLGNQEVKFLFWGKILQDSGTNGSYIVREIRGKRWNPPTHPEPTKTKEQDLEEPEWEFINMAPHFKTKEYNTKDFTEAEWNSEEKKARIQFLESQIKK